MNPGNIKDWFVIQCICAEHCNTVGLYFTFAENNSVSDGRLTKQQAFRFMINSAWFLSENSEGRIIVAWFESGKLDFYFVALAGLWWSKNFSNMKELLGRLGLMPRSKLWDHQFLMDCPCFLCLWLFYVIHNVLLFVLEPFKLRWKSRAWYFNKHLV